MSFPLCRVKKITSMSALNGAEEHNARLYEEHGKDIPNNIIPERNGQLGFNSYEQLMEGKNLKSAIEKRLQDLKIKPRKNSVIAHEYVLGVSKDWYEKANYDPQGMLSNVVKFITDKYGLENVASVAFHFDETNPHVHVITLPIVEKQRKWKNRNGQGTKFVKSLSASDFINGRDTLRKLQDDYFEFVSKYNRHEGVIYRGMLVEKQLKNYSRKTNHLLGELRELKHEIKETIQLIQDGVDVEKNKLKQEKQEKKSEELINQIEQVSSDSVKAEKKLEFRKKQNKGDGWKKGLDF